MRQRRVRDAGFSFISNELFVIFASTERIVRSHRLGFIPRATVVREKVMSLEGLETALAGVDDVGGPDYSDEGMLQDLRTERVIPAHQTRGYKLIELVRVYEAGAGPATRPLMALLSETERPSTVTLLDSLLDAIVRLDGEALIMHVGEKPYVVLSSTSTNAFRGPLSWGQVELPSRPLSADAVLSMLGQMLVARAAPPPR